jgi:hypothetical protein
VYERTGDVRPHGRVEDVDAHDDALDPGAGQRAYGAGAVRQLSWLG